MKKYYCACIITFIVIWQILTIALLCTGLIGYNYGGFGYRYGSALACPQLWLITLGIVLLLRRRIFQFVYKEGKHFTKAPGLICLCLGFVWLCLNIAPKLIMGLNSNDSGVAESNGIEYLYSSNGLYHSKKNCSPSEVTIIKAMDLCQTTYKSNGDYYRTNSGVNVETVRFCGRCITPELLDQLDKVINKTTYRKEIREELLSHGYIDVPSFSEFSVDMKNPANVDTLYKTLVKENIIQNTMTLEEFSNLIVPQD